MGGMSVWQLLIIAVIVLALFGTKKLRNVGSDLGSAVKGFKKAMNDDENDEAKALNDNSQTKQQTQAKEKDQA